MLFHDPIEKFRSGVNALGGQSIDLGQAERGPFFDPLVVPRDRVQQLWIGEPRQGKADRS